jgi:hypothetical protein
VDKLSLQALDHALVFTVAAGVVYMRPFAIDFKKSGTRVSSPTTCSTRAPHLVSHLSRLGYMSTSLD